MSTLSVIFTAYNVFSPFSLSALFKTSITFFTLSSEEEYPAFEINSSSFIISVPPTATSYANLAVTSGVNPAHGLIILLTKGLLCTFRSFLTPSTPYFGPFKALSQTSGNSRSNNFNFPPLEILPITVVNNIANWTVKFDVGKAILTTNCLSVISSGNSHE